MTFKETLTLMVAYFVIWVLFVSPVILWLGGYSKACFTLVLLEALAGLLTMFPKE